jgi:tetratricopeptide (TPR) repeat protein
MTSRNYTVGMHLPDGLTVEIKQAKTLAQAGDFDAALDLASKTIKAFPGALEAWLTRAYVHELNSSYAEAEADLNQATLIGVLEPHVFYTRGRMRYSLERYKDAGMDFQEGLRLCDLHRNDYYRSELHFWSGAVFLELGDKKSALEAFTRLPDDFSSFINGPIEKKHMLARCD